MRFPLAEKFKAPQGEGLYAGTPMAFVRLAGCSVGQTVCTACDTDFDRMRPELGGGLHWPDEIRAWMQPYRHLCITGGEPLDRNLLPLLGAFADSGVMCHIETSGTRDPQWLADIPEATARRALWVTVSPKPGYLGRMIARADEIKVIVGGLGDGPGWPTLDDAVRWADDGRLVYVQPRNLRTQVDRAALDAVMAAVDRHPQLRLSVQLHKFLETR